MAGTENVKKLANKKDVEEIDKYFKDAYDELNSQLRMVSNSIFNESENRKVLSNDLSIIKQSLELLKNKVENLQLIINKLQLAGQS